MPTVTEGVGAAATDTHMGAPLSATPPRDMEGVTATRMEGVTATRMEEVMVILMGVKVMHMGVKVMDTRMAAARILTCKVRLSIGKIQKMNEIPN